MNKSNVVKKAQPYKDSPKRQERKIPTTFKFVPEDEVQSYFATTDEPFFTHLKDNEHIFEVTTKLDILDDEPPTTTGDDTDLLPWSCPPFRMMWHPLKPKNLLYDLESRDIEKAKLLKCDPYLIQLILDHLEYLFPTSYHHPELDIKIYDSEDENSKVVDKLYQALSGSLHAKHLIPAYLNTDHNPPDITELFTHRDSSENLLKEIIRYWVSRRQEAPQFPPQKPLPRRANEKTVPQYPLIPKNRFRKMRYNDCFDVFHFSEEHEYNIVKIKKTLKNNIDELYNDLKFAIQMGNSLLTRELILYQQIIKDQNEPDVPDYLDLFPTDVARVDDSIKPKAIFNPYVDGSFAIVDADTEEVVHMDFYGNIKGKK